jgi:hypothetical protein
VGAKSAFLSPARDIQYSLSRAMLSRVALLATVQLQDRILERPAPALLRHGGG